jgi:hypothetical protein
MFFADSGSLDRLVKVAFFIATSSWSLNKLVELHVSRRNHSLPWQERGVLTGQANLVVGISPG